MDKISTRMVCVKSKHPIVSEKFKICIFFTETADYVLIIFLTYDLDSFRKGNG